MQKQHRIEVSSTAEADGRMEAEQKSSDSTGMPQPLRSLTVVGQISGLAVTCVIDTGATDSIFSAEAYQRIPEEQRPILMDDSGEYAGVDGRRLRTYGRIESLMVFGHVQIHQSLLVAEVEGDVLLGMDFLTTHKCHLDIPRGTLKVGEELLSCWDENEENAHFRVVSRARVELAPHQSTIVAGKIRRTGRVTECGIIESNLKLSEKEGVIVGRTLVSTLTDDVPVHVLNSSEETVVLKTNQLLGWCESVMTCPSDASVTGLVRNMNTKPIKDTTKKIPSHLNELFTKSSVHLNDAEREEWLQHLLEYQDIFSKGKGDYGRTNLVKHHIDTGNARPIKQPPRRLPFAKQQIEKEEIARMREQNVIRPSTSPWASPVVLVTKKDGTMRFCVDYRRLNDVTVKDAYPLPRVDDCLDSLAGAQWFSTMDLCSGYWQVEMEEESKPKTAFATRSGLYEFNVMAFGLACAPSTFERLMEEVVRGLQWEECLIYLDDIISFGKDFRQCLERLSRVFDRLRQANLKLKPSKCHFFQTEVDFLGHTVSRSGIQASEDKVKAVNEWPVPVNVREVRSFLGLCSYYRKFVKGFAEIARPISALVKKEAKFVWTSQCQEAFEKLKYNLTHAPVLAYPRVEGQFILDTDASRDSVGAVLSQEQDGVERPVAYYSKTLSTHERKYCITRKEMLAVVCAARKFKSYLWGRRSKLRTDNAAVSYMTTLKEPENQLARWLEELSPYHFELVHRAGRSHNNADSLSRRPCRQCGRKEQDADPGPPGPQAAVEDGTNTGPTSCSLVAHSRDKPSVAGTCAVITRQQRATEESPVQPLWLDGWDHLEMRDSQLRDPEIGLVMKALDDGRPRPDWSQVASKDQAVKVLWGQWKRLKIQNGVLYRRWEEEDSKVRWQVVVPVEKRKEVLQHLHASPGSGHMGVNRTIERVKLGYFWVGIRRQVRDYCRQCDDCVAMKMSQGGPKAPLQTQMTGLPAERIAVDITGPFPVTRDGNKYIVVIGDYFTKWSEAIAIPNQEAGTVARVIAEKWICHWGAPRFLHSDQGRNFEAEVFKQVMDLFDIKKTRTSALHPQGNGMIERFNRTLVRMLAIYTKDHPEEWDQHLCFASMAYNSSVHSTTGFTPFKLRFGHEMRLPLQALTGNPNETTETEERMDSQSYLDELKHRLSIAHKAARVVMKKNMQTYKDRYDVGAHSRHFEVGQAVWLYRPHRKKGVCPKLQSKWDKVYVVTDKLDDVLYRVQKGRKGKAQIVHIQRLMPYQGPNVPTWWRAR